MLSEQWNGILMRELRIATTWVINVHVGDIQNHPPEEMERQLKAKGSIKRKNEIVLVSGGPVSRFLVNGPIKDCQPHRNR